MPTWLRHRHLVYLPFAVLLVGTIALGQLNSVDARGVAVDMSTGEPVKDVPIVFGSRQTVTDAEGRYELLSLPRGARVTARPRFSYSQQSVPAEATRIELPPITLNLQVNEKGTEPPKGVGKPEVRQNDKVLGTGTDTGSVVVVPYPEIGSKLLVCAAGYRSLEIEARGTIRTIELEFGGAGCPALPSPSPSPGASPSGSPAPSPTASPTATP